MEPEQEALLAAVTQTAVKKSEKAEGGAPQVNEATPEVTPDEEGQGSNVRQFTKRSVSSVPNHQMSKSKKVASKQVGKEDDFTNNKVISQSPSGRPPYFKESRTAQTTIRLRPTVLKLAMAYGENEWGETSRNSVLERLLCKALDIDLKTLEPKS